MRKHKSAWGTKVLALFLSLAMCLSMLPTMALVPMTAFAEEAPSFGGGTGTQEDPWLITSKEDLIALAVFLNSGKAETFDTEATGIGNCYGYYFKQTADIDLTDVSWEPIGYSGGYYFAGNYDGDGHSIKNAISTGKVDPDGFATAGIFGWVAFGSVENLHVKNANFVATGQNNYSYVGGIAGVCYGSSIINCSVVNSSLESKRNNNNNCAGSIVGYSTGGTFEKCAAENNQVKTMAYGGGFVGEVDDDYGVGTSTFTNCYTANCSVNSKTDDVQGVSLVDGFAGEMTASTLTVKNCYVYQATLSTEGTAVPTIKATGVFAGHLWGGSSIDNINCFFGACGTTENVGTASEKTEEEFRNDTVANLLGEAFAQVGDYPKINGPADYSSVDAAIAKANALNKDEYKDFSGVEAAIAAVVRDKNITEQAEVDAMAQAINNAIAALQYKDADYTKVDVAITFNTNGGSPVQTQWVTSGGKLSNLPTTTKEGYTFAGWYTDEALTQPFSADTAITKNTVLYAKWTEKADPNPDDGITVGRVTGLKAIKKTTTTLKLTFNKVEGASGYEIYDAETNELLTTCTTQKGADKLVKTITGLNAGEVRKYKVRAYVIVNGEKHYGAFSKVYTKATAERTPVLLATVTKTTGTSVKLRWTPVDGAAKYQVYGGVCSETPVRLKTVSGETTDWTSKSLKRATSYKYYVVALDEAGKKIATAPIIHVVTNGSKYGNPEQLTLTSDAAITMTKGGKVASVLTELTASPAEKEPLTHIAALRYRSDDKTVAKVDKDGVITAVNKGTCTVYVIAQNGLYQEVTVTVE